MSIAYREDGARYSKAEHQEMLAVGFRAVVGNIKCPTDSAYRQVTYYRNASCFQQGLGCIVVALSTICCCCCCDDGTREAALKAMKGQELQKTGYVVNVRPGSYEHKVEQSPLLF